MSSQAGGKDLGNRPKMVGLEKYAAHYGIDFDLVYEIVEPSEEERSEMRRSAWKDTRRASYAQMKEGGRYVAYAGDIKDKGGMSGEGALSMGFIRLMDVETRSVVTQMGVLFFQKHAHAVGAWPTWKRQK